jgi:hypothetical protein
MSLAAPPLPRGRAISVFAILLGAYLGTSSFRVETIDTGVRLEVARSLAREGSPAIPEMQMRTPFGIVGSFAGGDGRHYSIYGLGQSLLMVPAVVLGGERDAALATLVNPLATAATGALLVLIGAALGFSATAAIRLGLAFGLCTLAWPQSKLTFEAPLEMLCLTGAVLFLLRPGRGAAAAAGGFVGFALLTRPSAVVMVPGLAILLRCGDDSRGRATAACAGVIPGLALALFYNHLRWGSPFATGYPFTGFRYFEFSWEGFVGLLGSPGRGFFWYSPILLLAPFGFRRLWKRERAVAAAVAALCLSYVGFLSFTTIWHGDWTWGPRHLLPIVPVTALAMLPTLEGRLRRTVAVPLVALSLGLQIVGTTINYEAYFLWHNAELRRAGRVERAGRYHFGLASSQIYVQTRQAILFWGDLRRRVASYDPDRDKSPYHPILEGGAPITVRVPDVWWIYWPMIGVSPLASGSLALACLLLIGGGTRRLLLPEGAWRSRTG